MVGSFVRRTTDMQANEERRAIEMIGLSEGKDDYKFKRKEEEEGNALEKRGYPLLQKYHSNS